MELKEILETGNLAHEATNDATHIPRFLLIPNTDAVTARTNFITLLYDMYRGKKYIMTKENPIDNEKCTFHCILLSHELIGDQYKANIKLC